MAARSVAGGRWVLLAVAVALAGCGGGDSETGEPEPPLVATLGDSITAGAPRWSPNPVFRALLARPTRRSQWQHWAEQAADGALRFRNCGVEGERTDEIELRLEECTDGAEAVVVQGGTNDVIQGQPPAAAAANIRDMIRRAKADGLRTLVTTVPPLNARHPRWAPEVLRLNALIRAVARREAVPLIDFFALLEDPRRPGRMPAPWTADEVHPSVAGYARLGRAAARQLG